MKGNSIFAFCLLFSMFMGLGGCKSRPNSKTDYNFTLKDSLYWERQTIDTTIKVPYSVVYMTVDPSKMERGEKRETSKGQANVIIEKIAGDTILVTASCDSLELVAKGLQEKLTKISDENGKLKEEIKQAPNVFLTFLSGTGTGAFIVLLLIMILVLKTKRN